MEVGCSNIRGEVGVHSKVLGLGAYLLCVCEPNSGIKEMN